ncbi:glycoside hydrolase family 3 N-terminal domain-containing protein [Acuticoccus sp. I52.16.1]|uniref:glycoside hydrolase family 3 N-terminal domain-containing protein n=1 Tax=Acuticoccus sp. I52.16.1 TaxID=2928472 RepID=UPI001FD2B543|nr:glycoside hydrolase family 3 N-terminal domain-containing protein [Acuticoccus sp. I52.16.1]UOM32748.1 glycoside hydrolase family 3 C-terminal domain-containing protein [Acuticoccus sp. I52.16.1]
MSDNDFVAALLQRMTLAEKIGQLNLLSAGEGPETGSPAVRNIEDRLKSGRLGGLFGTKSVRSVRAWQEIAVAGSRHGIPLFFAEDVIHGHRTIFPLPVALGCAFNPQLWHDVARVAATEAAAEGINHVYAPMIDIARDPRWGRIAESPGEDPFLAARYAEAMVKGFEGDDPTAPDTVVSCLKHFLAYGAAVGGRDYDNANLSPEEAIGVYAEPFRAGVAAGAGSIMGAFNALNKRPMHAHRDLIRGWLRGTAGFDGLMVADYTGIMELAAHGLGDRETVAGLALIAGIDMDMIGEDYLDHLPRLAEEGLSRPESGIAIPADDIRAAIDEACGRVLALKHRIGLFDDPFRYCDEERAARFPLAPAHRRVARGAIAESSVLLKNDGILPLAPGKRIAMVGAIADDQTNLLGTWAVSGDHRQAVTLLEGLHASYDGPITCVKGADIVDDEILAARLNVHGQTVFLDPRSAEAMLTEAVHAAEAADVTVAVVGEAKEASGECSSVTDLALPEPQRVLIRALAATGTPLVLVVKAGRPLALEEEIGLADAVLYVWFAGTEAGHGIADLLTGKADPSGRLASAFPARTGQVPVFSQAEPTGRPYPGRFEKFKTGYLDLPDSIHPATGLFPFGFGLSYTSFGYGAPRVDAARLSGPDAEAVVRVTVTNTGPRPGTEVVQLYVSDPVARITRPIRELKGFEKITLAPGEARDVAFRLTRRDLAYAMGETMTSVAWVWDPGTFVLGVGPNSRDLQSIEIVWSA